MMPLSTREWLKERGVILTDEEIAEFERLVYFKIREYEEDPHYSGNLEFVRCLVLKIIGLGELK